LQGDRPNEDALGEEYAMLIGQFVDRRYHKTARRWPGSLARLFDLPLPARRFADRPHMPDVRGDRPEGGGGPACWR